MLPANHIYPQSQKSNDRTEFHLQFHWWIIATKHIRSSILHKIMWLTLSYHIIHHVGVKTSTYLKEMLRRYHKLHRSVRHLYYVLVLHVSWSRGSGPGLWRLVRSPPFLNVCERDSVLGSPRKFKGVYSRPMWKRIQKENQKKETNV